MDVGSQGAYICLIHPKPMMLKRDKMKKRYVSLWCCFFFIALIPSLVFCQELRDDRNPQEEKYWSGLFSFGISANNGNTRNKNVLGKMDCQYKRERWRTDFQMLGKFTSTKGEKTQEKMEVAGMSEYYFLIRHSVFGRLDFRYDDFDPYKTIFTFVVGYGWLAVENEKIELTLLK